MTRGPSAARGIPVVYGVDDRFARPLAASIASAMENLTTGHTLEIYVIDGGLSRLNRARIEESFSQRPCSITWLSPATHNLTDLRVGGAITVATYYRLLIPELLPIHHEKAIYLDADVIVEGDLSRLWAVPLGDHHLLAVQDQGVRVISGPYGLSNYRELGIPEGAKYFNAGVLVFNLERWRKAGTARLVLEYIRSHYHHIRFWDQDGLNALLWREWLELEPRWNQMPQLLQIRDAADSPFDSDTFRRAVEEPWIIHYSAYEKPWRFGCRHPASERFFRYLDKTAYRGFRPSRWRTRLSDVRDFIGGRLRKLAGAWR